MKAIPRCRRLFLQICGVILVALSAWAPARAWDKGNLADYHDRQRVGAPPLKELVKVPHEQPMLSLGLYMHVPGQSAEQLVAEADASMYVDKEASRRKTPVEGKAPATAH